MLTPIRNEYGLGFGVQATDGQASFSHGGSNAGFRCEFRGYRGSARGAVVMTNGENGGRLGSEVLSAIAAEYGWPDYRQRAREVVPMPRETPQSYVGTYLMGNREVNVRIEGDRLTVAPEMARSPSNQPAGASSST